MARWYARIHARRQRILVVCIWPRPHDAEAVRALGIEIARRRLRLAHGGSSLGMRRTLADVALEAGAEVIDVIPETLLQREVAHRGLTRLPVVSSMHERKAMMCDLADASSSSPQTALAPLQKRSKS